MLSAVVAIAAPPIIPPALRKFDHNKHAEVMKAEGKSAMDCAGCHKVDPSNGRVLPGREHARCTGCHDIDRAEQSCDLVKVPGPKSPARQCQVCHVATRRECLPADLPPPPKATSFVSHFAHNKHITLGESITRDCAVCHRAETGGGAVLEGHAACSGCHNGRGVDITMSQCAACHTTQQLAKTRPADVYSLVPFDHVKHRQSSPSGGKATCLSCHREVANSNADVVPAPTMISCQQSCHDGKQAFSTTGTSCTKCHKGSDAPAKQRTDQTFSHSAHGHRNVNIAACGDCHTSNAEGVLSPPGTGKDHMPCAQSGCHQTEFASRKTIICGNCHDAEAPWAHAIARAQKGGKTEWFPTINHKVHMQITGGGNAACAGCHGDQLAGAPSPTEHKGCATGGKCHGGSQAPPMTACATCHQMQAPARGAVSEWAVAATFKHVTHGNDPRTHTQTKCVECHQTVATANDLASIKTPTMDECGGCHNGTAAFKSTGYECARCHTRTTATSPGAISTTPLRHSAVLTAEGEPRPSPKDDR